jgi:glycosyltransferase involved in cell wall biosynthesis
VVSWASLKPHNGYVTLLSQVPAQFAVVGSFSDPYKEAYRKLFETNNIPGVVFTGYLSREEMACLYGAASALVFPSHYEGFGFPVLEAMAHGCPVITTNVSSLPEVAGTPQFCKSRFGVLLRYDGPIKKNQDFASR